MFLFSNDFLMNEIISYWEYQPVPLQEIKNHKIGIVLTGITAYNKQPNDRVYINFGGDRVLHAVQLYKLKKIDKILVTGGVASLFNKAECEAEELKKVFLLSGVKEEDIILETKAKNTRENALFTRKIIDSLQISDTPILITSAFHMRRAHSCFSKVGLKVHPFPVNFYSRERKFTPDNLIIPSESALGGWSMLLHELVGYIVYKVKGYT